MPTIQDQNPQVKSQHFQYTPISAWQIGTLQLQHMRPAISKGTICNEYPNLCRNQEIYIVHCFDFMS